MKLDEPLEQLSKIDYYEDPFFLKKDQLRKSTLKLLGNLLKFSGSVIASATYDYYETSKVEQALGNSQTGSQNVAMCIMNESEIILEAIKSLLGAIVIFVISYILLSLIWSALMWLSNALLVKWKSRHRILAFRKEMFQNIINCLISGINMEKHYAAIIKKDTFDLDLAINHLSISLFYFENAIQTFKELLIRSGKIKGRKESNYAHFLYRMGFSPVKTSIVLSDEALTRIEISLAEVSANLKTAGKSERYGCLIDDYEMITKSLRLDCRALYARVVGLEKLWNDIVSGKEGVKQPLWV